MNHENFIFYKILVGCNFDIKKKRTGEALLKKYLILFTKINIIF